MNNLHRRTYDQAALDYVRHMAGKMDGGNAWNIGDEKKDYITLYAGILGVSAGAIAGALAEEADSYFTDTGAHEKLDRWADDGVREQTHETLAASYRQVIEEGIIDEKTKLNTLTYYAMRDIGPGNIRLAVAIRAIQQYFEDNPANPLGLKTEYLTDYTLIAKDLLDQKGSALTVAVAALELRKAQTYFETNVDPDYWASLPQSTRDGIIITAYNNGLPAIERGRLNAVKAFGVYQPIPGAGESGGMDHEANAKILAEIIGLIDDYGKPYSIELVSMGSDAVVKMAMQNDTEGLAFRYALINLQKSAIIGVEYDVDALALENFSEQYFKDRYSMFISLNAYSQADRIDRTISAPFGIPFGSAGDYYFNDLSRNLDITFDGTDLGLVEQHKVIFGSSGNDTAGLIGGSNSDRIYGGDGDDILQGNGGNDYLEGGKGKDTYILGDGVDTIYDSDRNGVLYYTDERISGKFVSTDGCRYFSEDKKYLLIERENNQWELSAKNGSKYDKIAYLNDWQSGQYGISVEQGAPPDQEYIGLQYPNAIAYLNFNASRAPQGVFLEGGTKSDSFTGSGYSDIIITGDGNLHYVTAQGGDDFIIGGSGRDFIIAGANSSDPNYQDDDTVWGGSNSDIIQGGGGNDILWADDGSNSYLVHRDDQSFERGDWISGGFGDDFIYGGNAKDVLCGGAGADHIYGGAGDDLILGDGHYTSFSGATGLSWASGSTYSYVWKPEANGGAGGFVSVNQYDYGLDPVMLTSGTVFQWEWSVNGDNFSFTAPRLLSQERVTAGGGNDYIDGGLGDDFIAGQTGDDILYGGEGDDIIYGDDVGPMGEGNPDGNDWLFASAGKDKLFGGGGNDQLDASDNDNDLDILYGGDGDDLLISGTGHDELYGENGDDELRAGADGSKLYGGAGSDLLFGGAGNDRLDGGDGDDWLVGGKGADDLYGGAGADKFLFSISDLFDATTTSTVRDAGVEDRLYLSGTSIDQIDFFAIDENLWQSRDSSLQIKMAAGGLMIQALAGDEASEGEIIVLGFSNGILGLNLPPYQPWEEPDNHQPEVAGTVAVQQATQDQPFTLTLPEDLFIDPDGDVLTYSARLDSGAPLPAWLTFDPLTRTLSGTPGNSDVSSLLVKITATDAGGLYAYHSFVVEVENVNDAPEAVGSLADQQATAGEVFSFALPAGSFRDIDQDTPVGDTLTYSATLADGSPLPVWLSFNAATGVLSGTPAVAGSLSVRITATDLAGETASQVFGLIVDAAPVHPNRAPEVGDILANQTATQDAAWHFTLPANAFRDIDGDVLTYGVTLADGSPLPSWLAFDAATRILSGTPANADVGTLSFKVTVTDPGGLSASQTFGLSVANVNDAPLVAGSIAQQQATQDQLFSLILPASLFSDPDGDALAISVALADGSALPGWLTFNAATRTLSGTPANTDVGSLSFKVTATDPGGLSASQTFGLNIANINDAPEAVGTLPSQQTDSGQVWQYVIPADAFRDIDGDALTYTVGLADGSPLPAWLTFDAASRTLSGTPGNGDTGELSFRITATDPGGLSVAQSLNLNVHNHGLPPVAVGELYDMQTNRNQPWYYSLPTYQFYDPEGGTLSFSVTLEDGSPLPAWLTLMEDPWMPGQFTLHGTPGRGDVGDLRLRITATDPDGLSTSLVQPLTITDYNNAPTAAGWLAVQRATEYQPFSFGLGNLFTDPDGDSLTQSVTLTDGSALPSWLRYDAATGTVSGTAGARGEPVALKVTATDAFGDSSSQTVWLQIQSDPSRHPGENIIQVNGGIPTGTEGDDYIESTGSGIYYTNGGNDTIITHGGIVYAGAGNDTIFSTSSGIFYGEGGDDHIITHGGIVNGGAGDDVIESRSMGGIYDGGDGNDRITMMGGIAHGGSGNDSIVSTNGGILYGDDGDDTIESWRGGILDGGNGNDTLIWHDGGSVNGGKGDDLLISANAGYNDYYRLNQGDGHDRIRDAGGNNDSLYFGSGIDSQSLWLTREGNDLRIDHIGTSDGVTIEGWYSDNGQHQIERISAGSKSLVLAQVDSLVQAMASFAPPAPGQMTLPDSYQAALNPVLASSWR